MRGSVWTQLSFPPDVDEVAVWRTLHSRRPVKLSDDEITAVLEEGLALGWPVSRIAKGLGWGQSKVEKRIARSVRSAA